MGICWNVYIWWVLVVVPKIEKIKKINVSKTKAERKAKEREYINSKKDDVNVTKHWKERTIERTQLNVEKLWKHIIMWLLHKKNRLEYCKAKGTYRLTCKLTNSMYILSSSLDVITVLNYKEYKEWPRTADKYYKVINRSIRYERLKGLWIEVSKLKTILWIWCKVKD